MRHYKFDDEGNQILPIPKTITEINEYIKYLIEEEMLLQDVYLVGEISNFKRHTSGHFYFTLKDEICEIRAVMFRSQAQRVPFKPEDGMRVIAHARVGVFQQAGTYQLYVDMLQPDGVGSLHIAFEQLKQKLASEGLFDEEHKKALPKYPKRIGVVTSQTGAAIRDIINVATRRYPVASLVLFPTLVQGAGAVSELIRGVEYFNITNSVDVIIIARGGGSIEDLWAFNSEELAYVIFNSKIPIISGVGHEIDYTICDFVADKRAATPSAAAEIATPDINEIKNILNTFEKSALTAFKGTIEMYRDQLSALSQSRPFLHPHSMLDIPKMRFFTIAEKLKNAFNSAFLQKKHQFSGINAKLMVLNPMSILSRGYGAIFKEENIVKSIDNIEINDELNIQLVDGRIRAKVTARERKNDA